jgi:hypothetical protein
MFSFSKRRRRNQFHVYSCKDCLFQAGIETTSTAGCPVQACQTAIATVAQNDILLPRRALEKGALSC